jgi:hypothetical protein
MKIAGMYSFNGGKEEVTSRFPDLSNIDIPVLVLGIDKDG